MTSKLSWLALLAGALSLVTVFVASAERSHPANASAPLDPICSSSLACIQYDNNGTGPGVRGVSQIGNGLSGWTYKKSTSTSNAKAGVFGWDASFSGAFDSGVQGFSARGTGVSGISTSGSGVLDVSGGNPTLGIQTVNFPGVEGSSFYPGNPGQFGALGLTTQVFGTGFPIAPSAETGFGVYGTGSTGVEGVGQSAALSGALASQNYGVEGFGQVGVYAEGNNSNQACCPAAIWAVEDLASCGGEPCDIIFAQGPAGNAMSLDVSGNMVLAGTLTQNGAPMGIARAPSGRKVTTYSAQQTSPSLEDYGEGQLVNGQGFVSIAADFASVIDGHAAYLVFLTPDGDNRGLYVASKSPYGFVVRESQGGRSTLTFDYRIVARPSNERGARLAPAKTIRSLHVARPHPFFPPKLQKAPIQDAGP